MPIGDLLDSIVLLADRHDEAPIEPEHGGPLRLVVPKLYGWKSAKWIRQLEFLAGDQAATGGATAITCTAIHGANSVSTATCSNSTEILYASDAHGRTVSAASRQLPPR